jgi:hypothetical protein
MLKFSSSVKPTHFADREATLAAQNPPKRSRSDRMSLLPTPGFMSRGLPLPFPINNNNATEQSAPAKPPVAAPAPATVAKSTATSSRVTRFSARQAQKQQVEPPAPKVERVPATLPPVPPTSIGAPSPIRTLRSRVIPKRTVEPPKTTITTAAPVAPSTVKKEVPQRRQVQSQTVRKAIPAVPRVSSTAMTSANPSTPPKTSSRPPSSVMSTTKKVPRTQLKPELRKPRADIHSGEPSFETAESFKLFERQLEEAMRLGTASVGGIGIAVRKTVEETQPEQRPSIAEHEDDSPRPTKRRKL